MNLDHALGQVDPYGRCNFPGCCRSGPVWRAHEMLFGFVLAVVLGFLLAAGRN